MPVSLHVSTALSSASRLFPALVLACLMGACFTGPAFGKDREDDSSASNATPNIYLDLRTSYATVPAGALPVGFSSPALLTALQSLALAGGGTLPTNVSLPSRQSLAVDLPLTVDVTDTVSLYAGVSGTTTYGPAQGWSQFDVTSWNVGFQADLYSQNGGSIPTITWQSTITQAIPNGPTGTTTFNNILEFDYAFDADATRGMLAGFQDTRVEVATALARIHPNIIGYVGGYYQWPSNWKFTGRVGVQHFGGAQLLNFAQIQSFTQPILRLDLDRMDDNDNRQFGVTAQIIWMPKPSYQLTLRTPLYFVRN
ncbi:hypothetical protein [Bradyrhizobium sp. CER78]|uniref:hypothetical protein n=1 Tax=Bradyrhizobium sp. CER78 TaxID=3039162 RepID=UPI00244AC63D|nr:hypothetical protein [Bradyrhizobium sp. CER78]MDH2381745.1 hypothetical protein [Bradyrhizobium sp. CER78]